MAATSALGAMWPDFLAGAVCLCGAGCGAQATFGRSSDDRAFEIATDPKEPLE